MALATLVSGLQIRFMAVAIINGQIIEFTSARALTDKFTALDAILGRMDATTKVSTKMTKKVASAFTHGQRGKRIRALGKTASNTVLALLLSTIEPKRGYLNTVDM